MRIAHVITDLDTGGAETMLLRLLQEMDGREFEASVIVLQDGGGMLKAVRQAADGVFSLGLRPGHYRLGALWNLRQLMCRLRPDLVQGWMYHGNLAASLAGRWAPGRVPVAWNIRHSLESLGHEKRLTRVLIRGGARLSKHPATILYNSQVSLEQHVAAGYHRERSRLVPNGFDLAHFQPMPAARPALRERLGLGAEVPLVGVVGRFHPIKGQAEFLKAVPAILIRHPEVHFVLAGLGLEDNNRDLQRLISGAAWRPHLHLLGELADVRPVMAGLDLLCLPSLAEGFPNVLGEAMACGVPCVATKVGDVAEIVGDTGRLVESGNVPELAAAVNAMLDLTVTDREYLGVACRKRIRTRYSLAAIAQKYAEIYREIAI